MVESAKGECNLGQQEIAFRFDEALKACDKHTFYKSGAKEIAAQHGKSISFMAKYDQREGNSCHIHFSLADLDGNPVLPGDGEHGFSPVMEHFMAGQLDASRNSPISLPRTSTPTRGSSRAASRPLPSLGAWTTAAAPCGWWATAAACVSRIASAAGTLTPISRRPH